MPPWTPAAAEYIKFQQAEERDGRPPPLFTNCLPEAMPAWMLVTHNSMEILFTPGRVTMLGESSNPDANAEATIAAIASIRAGA